MFDTKILYNYFFMRQRIKKADYNYAYLILEDSFLPLKRNKGKLSILFPYKMYGYYKRANISNDKRKFDPFIVKSYEELSSFFMLRMLEDEHKDKLVFIGRPAQDMEQQ